MASGRKSKIVKCDQKVNITATFGSDLMLEGSTAIPNILLKVYNKIGITDFQMMLLIHMFRFCIEEGEVYPTPEMMAEYMHSDPIRIKRELAELLEKEIVGISQYIEESGNRVVNGYDFEPLFLKISDVWAGIRAREIEETEKRLKAAGGYGLAGGSFKYGGTELISIFEKEFGRAISPLEAEQIGQWAEEMGPAIIVEALKRAVIKGKYNFKYINGILLEWKKNNLRTIESILEYEREFQERRLAAKNRRKSEAGPEPGGDGGKSDSKKKAFIRSLYVKC
ncbi:MAG: DnaD domain protein [Pelotomaculum sp.]|uniref:Putative primosome component and related proteins n=1 Tax=Pelotomaculum thermopropionicum (strain DSM 13744 / JCM 10971 / SI) TaxID=370438 RepID=A5D3I3_PELTS|nr:DnaD domain protein [Pelotomaculum sp.]BAF59190.1 putative primosome component and related proteins [Pelotomaculum thermopropionicum SI]